MSRAAPGIWWLARLFGQGPDGQVAGENKEPADYRKGDGERMGKGMEHPLDGIRSDDPGAGDHVPTVPTQESPGINSNARKEGHAAHKEPADLAAEPACNQTLHRTQRNEAEDQASEGE